MLRRIHYVHLVPLASRPTPRSTRPVALAASPLALKYPPPSDPRSTVPAPYRTKCPASRSSSSTSPPAYVAPRITPAPRPWIAHPTPSYHADAVVRALRPGLAPLVHAERPLVPDVARVVCPIRECLFASSLSAVANQSRRPCPSFLPSFSFPPHSFHSALLQPGLIPEAPKRPQSSTAASTTSSGTDYVSAPFHLFSSDGA